MLLVLINDISKCFIVCSVLILTVFMCEMRLRTACRWGGGGGSEYLREICTTPTTWRQTIGALRIGAVRIGALRIGAVHICLLLRGLLSRNLILDPCFYLFNDNMYCC